MLSVFKDIVTQHIAVLGKTGSGKTSTAKLLIEHVVADGARVCILDPIKSDWWGLTSSADGKRPGLPFHILGGPRGHVPLHSSAGKAIAEVVASSALPLSILDMADFEPGGQAKFFVDFAPALLRKMRGVVYLVIEEAHLFAPKERSGIGAENLSIHWAKTMATAGRSKGIRLVLVTQRTQALHNALLGSCDTMIAHRLTAPADQEPVIKWLKANTTKAVLEQVAGSLSSLKTGDAWVCAGEAKRFEVVHFPRITTYDNTATPTGDGDTRVIKTAEIDQDKLRAIIGDAVEKAKGDDPRELRKRIAQLERDIAAQKLQPAHKPTQVQEKRVEVPVITDAHLARVDTAIGRLEKVIDGVQQAFGAKLGALRSELSALTAAVRSVRQPSLPMGAPRTMSTRPLGTETTSYRSGQPSSAGRRTPTAAVDSAVTPARQRILNAIAFFEGIGLAAVDKVQLSLMVGVPPTSGGYKNNLGALRAGGYIDYPTPGDVALTDQGRTLAEVDGIPTTTEELHAALQGKLPPAKWKLLEQAIGVYPHALGKDDLADRVGVPSSSGGFKNNLGSLRSLGLIDYPQPGTVAATRVLFLEER